MDRTKVLVVDDDDDVRSLLRQVLGEGGPSTRLKPRTAASACASSSDGRPDLVVLDVSMPELDGWQTLERIRELGDTPVPAADGEHRRARQGPGLNLGADDYLTKPFGNQELVARVQAILRRAAGAESEHEIHDDGLIQIDFAQRRVTVGGELVELTPAEFACWQRSCDIPNQVLSSDQLLDLAWAAHSAARRAR